MKKLFSKLIPIAAAVGLTFAAASAHAVTLKNGSGTTLATNVTSLDWKNTGTGVAEGIGPFGAPLSDGSGSTPATKFTFRYQSTLVGVTASPSTGLPGLDSDADGVSTGYEFTIVSKLHEVVQGIAGPTAYFGLDTSDPYANKVAIYYNATANANMATGTGFDDGQLVALFTVIPDEASSSFTVTGPNAGRGFTYLKASLQETGVDMVNANFLAGLSEMVIGIDFDSNLTYPIPTGGGYVKPTAFHTGGDARFDDYAVKGNDILFKVDGSSSLLTGDVPEPGSMMLMGMGMLGLVGAARRRKASK